jgi:DNA-binding Xre family transcriptional regulator
MGLRHHLAKFASTDQGADGKPTPYRIAKDAGISLNTVYKLVGDPYAALSWPVIAKLCKVLKCQPGDLLSYQEDAD